jgi:hypothetical protein
MKKLSFFSRLLTRKEQLLIKGATDESIGADSCSAKCKDGCVATVTCPPGILCSAYDGLGAYCDNGAAVVCDKK